MLPINARRHFAIALMALVSILAAACGDATESDDATADAGAIDAASDAAGIRVISAGDGAAIVDDPPEDLVILDVRTPEEFAEGHIEGATMIDFYAEDFADRLADLDPDVPYVIYCRSGNRSGQTTAILEELGFADVADIDGGILAWNAAELPTVLP